MDSAAHAARGALAVGGGLTLLQSLLARRPQQPSGFALAAGSFVGTFRLIESLGSKLESDHDDETQKGQERTTHVPSIAAGVAAIVAMYFLEAKKKGLLISYAALEAILLLVKEHTNIADIKHIEVPMAVLACHRIIYIWIFETHLLSKTQLAYLDKLTRVPVDFLSKVRAELPVNAAADRCAIFHPNHETCAHFHADFFRGHMKAAMKLYIPIYLVSAVLTKYDKWLWGPRPSVVNLALQYLRTCACLSLSFSIPLGFSCVSPIKNQRATVAIAGMLTALAMWIEHEKRRVAVIKGIAVYPLAAAGSQLGLAMGLTPRGVSMWQYLVFSASLAVLFQRPEKQNYKAMRLLFGHKVSSSSKDEKKATKADERPLVKASSGSFDADTSDSEY